MGLKITNTNNNTYATYSDNTIIFNNLQIRQNDTIRIDKLEIIEQAGGAGQINVRYGLINANTGARQEYANLNINIGPYQTYDLGTSNPYLVVTVDPANYTHLYFIAGEEEVRIPYQTTQPQPQQPPTPQQPKPEIKIAPLLIFGGLGLAALYALSKKR